MTTELQHDVFLRHSSADKPRLRRRAERPRAAGLRAWFDAWVIPSPERVSRKMG